MHYKKCLLFMAILLITANFLSNFNVEDVSASSNIIWVDDDYFYPSESDGSMEKPYTNIQSGIDGAEEGDTVFIREGTYSSFTLNRKVAIKGESLTNTFVRGGTKEPYLIEITSNYSSIENIKIWDTTPTTHRKAVVRVSPSANHVKIVNILINESYNGYGIQVEGDSTIIEESTIHDTKGVYLLNSNVNTIFNNSIYNCKNNYGIYMISSNDNHIEQNSINHSHFGIYSRKSSDNKYINNDIFDNELEGIKIKTGSGDTIKKNTIYKNEEGIEIASSSCNIISNTIYNNSIGIKIMDDDGTIKNNIINESYIYGLKTETGTSGNSIFNNTFKDKNSGYYAYESGNNNWYSEELKRGNYWKDFLGPDPNNESTLSSLDKSAFHYTKGGVLDKYPTGKYQKIPVISDPDPSHLESGVDLQPTLKVNVVDPEEGNMDVFFYYMKDNKSFYIDSVKNLNSGSNASIAFYSTIQGKNAVYSYLGTGFNFICNWYVIVKDQYSQSRAPAAENDSYIFTTIDTPLDNEDPIAIVETESGSLEFEIDKSIQFNSSKSYDNDGNITFYRWTFGDGESSVNVEDPSHKYSEPGEYEVTLTIIDNDGSSDTETIKVKINPYTNYPPIPNIKAPLSAYVGESIKFESTSFDPDTDDIIQNYTWYFSNNITYYGNVVYHTFNSPAEYYVTLNVSDKEFQRDITTKIVIENEPVEETPGFELTIALVSLLAIIIITRRKTKKR